MSGSLSNGVAEKWAEQREALHKEYELLHLVLYKNFNQHRRTRYFRSFHRAHKLVGRMLTFSKRLKAADIVELTLSPATHPAVTSPKYVESRAKVCGLAAILQSAVSSLVSEARVVTSTQKGAGFANFMAVLTGAVANYVFCVSQLRDTLRAFMEKNEIRMVATAT
jgi:hypothetical protein